ncbi:hypothetical protein H2200_012227 [Cladophialophora chaetospira]|uniref:SnoaL-like domain-containing protein n=1 Tax=Cladophialophora chaetospira TaxID=386627 RepID=A0AA38WYF8_9EURO|nr:hypothetical protein H2200_012227 [Cladophialophora chaetospira]
MDDFNKPGSVARSVAKSEIETLFHRYAVLAKETASEEKIAPLFTPDGVFRLPNGVAVKPANMLKVVQGNNPKFIRHHITSIEIDFISPNEAHTEAYYIAITHLSSMDHWGCWKDVVTRGSEGTWLIADRTIVVDGGDPKGWYKTTYPD